MYANPTVQHALSILRERGHWIIEPNEGDVACGEQGQGKLAQNSTIVEQAMALAHLQQTMAGKKVLITGGPTQEPIDDVRFIANRSSGKMAAALAQAATWMGAQVTVVSGPVTIPYPQSASVIRVQTADEMLKAALSVAAAADLVIGCAAVADYRLQTPFDGKLRSGAEALTLALVPNPDVISALAKVCAGRTVGFAAEPSADGAVALDKLTRKGLFAIAANDVSRSDIGFGSDYNELRVYFVDGTSDQSGRRSKIECAMWLLNKLA
jgi:phosphopantothenoylcysteine decarboxylase/phosphopantothenate--cysteine ligase